MQSQSLMFALFMLVAIPLLFILSDHEVYFITMGIFLFITSIKSFSFTSPKRSKRKRDLYDETEIEELEEETNLDIRKIGTGTKVAKSLLIVLFVLYCTFYTSHFIFNVIGALICLYYINDIVRSIHHYKIKNPVRFSRFKNYTYIGVNIITLVLIIAAAINKFMKYNL